jgi:hypothetical protein
MSEQQGLSQQDTKTETPVHADKAQVEGGEKPRVKYDKETFLNSSKRVSEIRDKIKSASSLEEITPLAQEGKAVEQNMRNMFDAAQDEAEAENKAFDERNAEEQKQRTLEMAKSGVLSFDELAKATAGQEAGAAKSAETDTTPSERREGSDGGPEGPETQQAAREQAIDDALEQEAAGLEANVGAATKAIEEAGGEDAIKTALEQMPGDGKDALKKQLEAEHARIIDARQSALKNAKDLLGYGAGMLNPLNALKSDDVGGALVMWGTGLLPATAVVTEAIGSLRLMKEKIGIMRENRRHKRELNALDKRSS